MSQVMTDENSTDGGPTRTTIEVDREVWRQVRAQAVAEGSDVSSKLEDILREHFDMNETDDNSK